MASNPYPGSQKKKMAELPRSLADADPLSAGISPQPSSAQPCLKTPQNGEIATTPPTPTLTAQVKGTTNEELYPTTSFDTKLGPPPPYDPAFKSTGIARAEHYEALYNPFASSGQKQPSSGFHVGELTSTLAGFQEARGAENDHLESRNDQGKGVKAYGTEMPQTQEEPHQSIVNEPKRNVNDNVLEQEFLHGETLQLRLTNVCYVSSARDVWEGTLVLTSYRLEFQPCKDGNASKYWCHLRQDYFSFPVGNIAKISSGQLGSSGRNKDSVFLSISCKDLRVLQFRFQDSTQVSRVFDLVKTMAFPLSEGHGFEWVFAFSYFDKAHQNKSDGWKLYDAHAEWERLGIVAKGKNESEHWRITQVNRDFQFAQTYPREFVVPNDAGDELLYAVGAFRSRARIPAMCWLHPSNGGSLWRCSQPKVGIGSNISTEDERFVESIRRNTQSQHVRIIDCRPFKNAMANKAKGMGYEDESRYRGSTISFQNIQNIHVVRASLEKLSAVVFSSASTSGTGLLAAIENTGWLNHIRSILVGAIKVSSHIARQGLAVIVHCSDGWDRTAQVTSLSQLLLDPYFRTLHGFQVLIEKEWLSFGYRFRTRTGHGMDWSKDSGDQRSPVFLQFIDCVWQLLNQFPTEFEFNEALLLFILESLYSCRFGTFILDFEYERMKNQIPEKTVSIWTEVNEHREEYINPFYEYNHSVVELLPRSTAVARQVELWKEYYMRYSVMPSLNQHSFINNTNASNLQCERLEHDPRLMMAQCLREAHSRIAALESRVLTLRSSVTQLTLRIQDDDSMDNPGGDVADARN